MVKKNNYYLLLTIIIILLFLFINISCNTIKQEKDENYDPKKAETELEDFPNKSNIKRIPKPLIPSVPNKRTTQPPHYPSGSSKKLPKIIAGGIATGEPTIPLNKNEIYRGCIIKNEHPFHHNVYEKILNSIKPGNYHDLLSFHWSVLPSISSKPFKEEQDSQPTNGLKFTAVPLCNTYCLSYHSIDKCPFSILLIFKNTSNKTLYFKPPSNFEYSNDYNIKEHVKVFGAKNFSSLKKLESILGVVNKSEYKKSKNDKKINILFKLNKNDVIFREISINTIENHSFSYFFSHSESNYYQVQFEYIFLDKNSLTEDKRKNIWTGKIRSNIVQFKSK